MYKNEILFINLKVKKIFFKFLPIYKSKKTHNIYLFIFVKSITESKKKIKKIKKK